MRNFYPDKPLMPYKKTTVNMIEVVRHLLSAPASTEVKRAAYVIFRIESANGQSGINNNYSGVQCDSARWGDPIDDLIIGVTQKKENKTGKERLFAAFRDFKGSVDFLLNRVEKRGLYVGGKTHKIAQIDVVSPQVLARAYVIEWVTGDPNANPSGEHLSNFLSIYKQAAALFSN